MVTAGTYQKEPLFHCADRLDYLAKALIVLAREYGWQLQAWAVFSNHYHFVANCEKPESLRRLVQYLHSVSAKHINKADGAPGRKVWHQYWDSQITFEKSFLSRLNYVHTNAVRHGLVRDPSQYTWCSASWFARNAPRPFYATVMRFPSDRIAVPDAFAVAPLG